MTPEVIAQAEQVIDSFIAAVKELQEGMAQGLVLLEGFKASLDATKAAQITAGKGRTHGQAN
jgi:hypothetical protein